MVLVLWLPLVNKANIKTRQKWKEFTPDATARTAKVEPDFTEGGISLYNGKKFDISIFPNRTFYEVKSTGSENISLGTSSNQIKEEINSLDKQKSLLSVTKGKDVLNKDGGFEIQSRDGTKTFFKRREQYNNNDRYNCI